MTYDEFTRYFDSLTPAQQHLANLLAACFLLAYLEQTVHGQEPDYEAINARTKQLAQLTGQLPAPQMELNPEMIDAPNQDAIDATAAALLADCDLDL